MSESNINIGIIGVGRTAQTVHLPAYQQIKQANILAIADIDETRVKWVASRSNIHHAYTDYRRLLENNDIQAVDVCVPTFLHHQVVMDSLAAGKHVFCEKPMALTLTHCRQMIAAAEKADRLLMIGVNQRYRPDVQMLKSWLDTKTLGKVYYIKAGWLFGLNRWETNPHLPRAVAAGSGALYDVGQPMLDLMLWLLDFPEIAEMNGSSFSLSEFNESDFATVYLKTKDQTTLLLEVSWSLTSETDFTYLTVNGAKGMAALNPLRTNKDKIILKEKDGVLINVTPPIKTGKSVYLKSYEVELRHFIDCIASDRTPVSPGRQMLASMEILKQLFDADKKT